MFITSSYAQFDWSDNGVPIRQGLHIEWQRTGSVGSDGSMIIAWSDTRQSIRDIYAQKIDSEGNYLWGVGGAVVVNCDGRQEDPLLVSDQNGGAYIIWRDYRDENYYGDIYAQHINSDGVLSYGQEGIALTNQPNKQSSLNICKDGLGGAYVIWSDKNASSYGDVYGTHLSLDGPLLSGIGIPLNTQEQSRSYASLETAGNGDAVFVWSETSKLIDFEKLDKSIKTISLEELLDVYSKMLKGETSGRYIIDLNK